MATIGTNSFPALIVVLKNNPLSCPPTAVSLPVISIYSAEVKSIL